MGRRRQREFSNGFSPVKRVYAADCRMWTHRLTLSLGKVLGITRISDKIVTAKFQPVLGTMTSIITANADSDNRGEKVWLGTRQG